MGFLRGVWAGVLCMAMGMAWGVAGGAEAVNAKETRGDFGGVYVDKEGMMRMKAGEAVENLTVLRGRAKAAMAGTTMKGELMGYVSLPRVLEEVRAAREEKREIPAGAKFLGGMTQVRCIFVFPDERDLVLAGPVEGLVVKKEGQPVGKISGRPVLQLDDVVSVYRAVKRERGGGTIGCSIDMDGDGMKKAQAAMDKNLGASDAEVIRALAAAMGPQKVRLFGVDEETRAAFVLVGADYRMKRMSMGLESSPAVEMGHGVDRTRTASNRFWFEAMYEPLRVTEKGDGYEIRGQRLQLKCGAQSFDERGATETAKRFAGSFTKNVPALAATMTLFADLQNVTDLGVVMSLIVREKLDEKAGWDMGKAVAGYEVEKYVPAKLAETLAGKTAGSIVAGGVKVEVVKAVEEREKVERVGVARRRPAAGWVVVEEE